MRVVITQQGSGSRILANYLGIANVEPFAVEPVPTEAWAKSFLEGGPTFRLMYNHLEDQPWLYELLKDYEVIHLYRDPARTFTRQMAKYREVENWTRDDLIDHVDFVKRMRDKVNRSFKNVVITHYEDFVRDLYLGEIRELNHL